jgi:hypothetical protein
MAVTPAMMPTPAYICIASYQFAVTFYHEGGQTYRDKAGIGRP